MRPGKALPRLTSYSRRAPLPRPRSRPDECRILAKLDARSPSVIASSGYRRVRRRYPEPILTMTSKQLRIEMTVATVSTCMGNPASASKRPRGPQRRKRLRHRRGEGERSGPPKATRTCRGSFADGRGSRNFQRRGKDCARVRNLAETISGRAHGRSALQLQIDPGQDTAVPSGCAQSLRTVRSMPNPSLAS